MGQEETVGQRLRRLRVTAGLSQRQLCKDSGYSFAYISRIESGQRTPSVTVLRVLATRLHVTAYYLEHGRPDPDRERVWQVVELARFWRARCRFLERRLAEFEQRMTADPVPLDAVLQTEVRRLREFGAEVKNEQAAAAAHQDASTA